MVLKTSEISNVAFSIFGLDIYWYAILIVAAIILGILWCKKNDGRFGIKYNRFMLIPSTNLLYMCEGILLHI